MKVDDFISIMKRVSNVKIKLEQENITGKHQQIILRIYIQDLTSRINTSMLGVI